MEHFNITKWKDRHYWFNENNNRIFLTQDAYIDIPNAMGIAGILTVTVSSDIIVFKFIRWEDMAIFVSLTWSSNNWKPWRQL